MNRKFFKTAYQYSKNSNGPINNERIKLGNREIETLKLLAKEIGYKSFPDQNLLDLGCADKFLEPATKNEGWIYQGLDYTDVNFECEPFPISSNSVDIVVSLAVLEHLKDPDNFISEIFRCLKPGGLIYLSTPNFQLDWKNFFNDPTHVRPYTPESLNQLLILSGFTSVSSFPGLRCKNIQWYRGKYRFLKAYYLLPFRNNTSKLIPSFLKGHSRSIFALGLKP